MTLRTLNYGNYGIFLIMGNAGFCPSAVLKPNSRKKGTLIIKGPLRILGIVWCAMVCYGVSWYIKYTLRHIMVY